MDEVLLTVISFNARPTGSSVAQPLVVKKIKKQVRFQAGGWARQFSSLTAAMGCYRI